MQRSLGGNLNFATTISTSEEKIKNLGGAVATSLLSCPGSLLSIGMHGLKMRILVVKYCDPIPVGANH